MKHMKILAAVTTTPLVLAANASDPYADWQAPQRSDFRGPCPMMNTLANHGFVPRNGRNLTRENVVPGIQAALNFDEDISTQIFELGPSSNPIPNSTFFTLENLGRHNILEHDASLSRTDAYYGNQVPFNQTVFDITKTYLTDELVTADMMANAKIARQVASRAFNPTYTFTNNTEDVSVGEMVSVSLVFGDKQSVTSNKTLIEYFFENERLPTELGWKPAKETVTAADFARMFEVFHGSLSLTTSGPSVVTSKRKLRFH